MRILFIVPSLSGGGAERVVAQLASALCERHEVSVACTWPEGNTQGTYDLDERVRVFDLWVRRLPPLPTHTLRVFAEYLTHARQIRKLKRHLHIDVCASFLTSCSIENIWSRGSERTVVSIRNILERSLDMQRMPAWAVRRIIAYSGRHADRVVCVSRNVAREQTAVFGVPARKTMTIYNPVDIASIAARGAEQLDDPSFEAFRAAHSHVVATMGRLVYQKGQWHLLRAFAALHATHPTTGLVVLGSGSLEPQLVELARTLGIADHVLFAGFQRNPHAYLARCDLYVMTSLHEGFSNALLEAGALGLPLVSADCNAGSRELLAPDTDPQSFTTTIDYAPFGVLVPSCSGNAALTNEPLEDAERQLVEALAQLLDDGDLRAHYGQQAQLRAHAYAPERIVAQWEQLFEELVGQSAS